MTARDRELVDAVALGLLLGVAASGIGVGGALAFGILAWWLLR